MRQAPPRCSHDIHFSDTTHTSYPEASIILDGIDVVMQGGLLSEPRLQGYRTAWTSTIMLDVLPSTFKGRNLEHLFLNLRSIEL